MGNLFMRFPKGVSKALTLSYDDGVNTDIRLKNILDKYGIKCTFNINAGLFGDPNEDHTGQNHYRLPKEEFVKEFKDSNHEIAIHGYTHPFLEQLPPYKATEEILKDREALEELFGYTVRGMAYPYGTYNDTVVEIVKNCGIAYARTVETTGNFSIPKDWHRLPATCHHNNKRLNELTNNFIENKGERGPLLFYLWGHSYEFNSDNNWKLIEEFSEKVGNRDDIWYATNIEIYDYIDAYNRLVFNCAMTTCENPTSKDIYFNYDGKNYCIKASEKRELI